MARAAPEAGKPMTALAACIHITGWGVVTLGVFIAVAIALTIGSRLGRL